MGTEERMGLLEREGAKAMPCNDRPPDYIVAQINRTSAGSLEPSCGAGEESFYFRGLRLREASYGMGPACLPAWFPHISISKSMNRGTRQLGNSSFEKLVDYGWFPALTVCLERPTWGLITVNLMEQRTEAAEAEKREEGCWGAVFVEMMMMRGHL